MFKNIASQKVAVFAWDQMAGAAKTGDAANISAQISKDGAACAATNDVAPTELDAVDAPGVYIFDMTQEETNADLIVITPVSSTANIVIRPVIVYTETVMRGTDNAALAATALTDAVWTDAKAGYIDMAISTVDTVVDGIKEVTDALTVAAAAKLALSAGTMVAGTVSHDNTAATTSVFYSDDVTEATGNHYRGRIILFTSGDLTGQGTKILAYALVTGEGKFTVSTLTEAPADNVTFIII